MTCIACEWAVICSKTHEAAISIIRSLLKKQLLCSLWHNLRQGNIHNRITDFAFFTLLIRSLSMVTNLTKPY